MIRTSTRDRAAIAALFAGNRLPPPLDADACLGKARCILADLERMGLRGQVTKIRYTSAERAHVEPRLFFKDLTNVRVNEPSSQVERTKLAAILYCVGRLLGIELDVLCVGQVPDYAITTKHQGTHGGKLQKGLDDGLFAALNGPGCAPPPTLGQAAIEGISMDPAQHEALVKLEDRDQLEWRALARLAGRGRCVSRKMLASHVERTGWTLEDIYRLNEGTLRPLRLGFEIDYGAIPFAEHMSAIQGMESKIRELEEEVQAASVLGQRPVAPPGEAADARDGT